MLQSYQGTNSSLLSGTGSTRSRSSCHKLSPKDCTFKSPPFEANDDDYSFLTSEKFNLSLLNPEGARKTSDTSSKSSSLLLTVDGVELRRKSILKQTRPVTPPRLGGFSSEAILEQAIERTLNFLQPHRRFTARQRALKHAFKWWDEDSANSSANGSRRPSRTVQFDIDGDMPTLIVMNGKIYRRGSLDSNSTMVMSDSPGRHRSLLRKDSRSALPGAVINSEDISQSPFKTEPGSRLRQKWQKLSRILQAVSSFQIMEMPANAGGRLRSMSDPELANTERSEDVFTQLSASDSNERNVASLSL